MPAFLALCKISCLKKLDWRPIFPHIHPGTRLSSIPAARGQRQRKNEAVYAVDVIESGPVSLEEPYSAFNIALMHSGTIFDGHWGFVKGGIWKVTEELARINNQLGVQTVAPAAVLSITEAGKDGSGKCAREIIRNRNPL